MNVLVIDDQLLMRDCAQRSLEEYEVQAVAKPEQGYQLIEEGFKVDAAVVDMKLEGVNGIEVVRRLKARYGVKVAILFTGYGSELYNISTTGVPCVTKDSMDFLPWVVKNEIALSQLPDEAVLSRSAALSPFSSYRDAATIVSHDLDGEAEALNCLVGRDKARISVYQSESKENKIVISIPSNVGCSVGCDFCLTGRRKKRFKRVLTPDELTALAVNGYGSYLAGLNIFPDSKKKAAYYISGEGDCLFDYNLDNCCIMIKRLSNSSLRGYPFVLTSVGHEQSLDLFIKNNYTSLPIDHHWSLNFPEEGMRGKYMPGVRGHRIKGVKAKYEQIYGITGNPNTASIIQFRGVNDTDECVDGFARLLANNPAWLVKVMAFNKEGLPYSLLLSPDRDEVEDFAYRLTKKGIQSVRIRRTLGSSTRSCGACTI